MEPSDPSKPTAVPKTTDYNTRVCLLYDFRAGLSAADSVRKIHAIFGADAVGLEGAKTWWKKFRTGNTKIADERVLGALRQHLEDILAQATASVLAALPRKIEAPAEVPVEDDETTWEDSTEETEETSEQWEDEEEEEEESELDDSDKENVNDDDEEAATCTEDECFDGRNPDLVIPHAVRRGLVEAGVVLDDCHFYRGDLCVRTDVFRRPVELHVGEQAYAFTVQTEQSDEKCRTDARNRTSKPQDAKTKSEKKTTESGKPADEKITAATKAKGAVTAAVVRKDDSKPAVAGKDAPKKEAATGAVKPAAKPEPPKPVYREETLEEKRAYAQKLVAPYLPVFEDMARTKERQKREAAALAAKEAAEEAAAKQEAAKRAAAEPKLDRTQEPTP
ncbi:Histone-lysine N-methyltransferase SETMAR [Aphelenchoides fujianensis]|nr:Histone-lysine N-methyltransferase SETMAR [Aphelenchoides fujianensis]